MRSSLPFQRSRTNGFSDPHEAVVSSNSRINMRHITARVFHKAAHLNITKVFADRVSLGNSVPRVQLAKNRHNRPISSDFPLRSELVLGGRRNSLIAFDRSDYKVFSKWRLPLAQGGSPEELRPVRLKENDQAVALRDWPQRAIIFAVALIIGQSHSCLCNFGNVYECRSDAYLGTILPGPANTSIQRVPELTPTAWIHSRTQS